MLALTQNVYHFIKVLKNVQLMKKDKKEEKRATRPHVVQNVKKKRDFELPEKHQTGFF